MISEVLVHVWHQCPVNTVLDTNPLEDHSQLFSLRTRRTIAGIVIDDAGTGKKNGEQSYKKKPDSLLHSYWTVRTSM